MDNEEKTADPVAPPTATELADREDGQEESTKINLNYMVCHDGSESSTIALDTVSKGLFKETDKLTVANIWNLEKEEYLHHSFKTSYIQDNVSS